MTPASLEIQVDFLMGGAVEGQFVQLCAPISLWGGVDPITGAIAEAGHPQNGAGLADRIVFAPALKGSTAGPGALLELIAAGLGPLAFVTPAADMALIAAAHSAVYVGCVPPALAVWPRWRDLAGDRAPALCRLSAISGT